MSLSNKYNTLLLCGSHSGGASGDTGWVFSPGEREALPQARQLWSVRYYLVCSIYDALILAGEVAVTPDVSMPTGNTSPL